MRSNPRTGTKFQPELKDSCHGVERRAGFESCDRTRKRACSHRSRARPLCSQILCRPTSFLVFDARCDGCWLKRVLVDSHHVREHCAASAPSILVAAMPVSYTHLT